jgi:hypothetical protein
MHADGYVFLAVSVVLAALLFRAARQVKWLHDELGKLQEPK